MVSDETELGISAENLYAALCYVGVLILVPILMKKNDPYVNWHIRQGLVVLVIIVISLVASTWEQKLGNLLLLITVIFNLIALVQAATGKKWKIPLLGDLATKFRL